MKREDLEHAGRVGRHAVVADAQHAWAEGAHEAAARRVRVGLTVDLGDEGDQEGPLPLQKGWVEAAP